MRRYKPLRIPTMQCTRLIDVASTVWSRNKSHRQSMGVPHLCFQHILAAPPALMAQLDHYFVSVVLGVSPKAFFMECVPYVCMGS